MYRTPSRRRTHCSKQTKLNLVPIMDSILILIFFLLFTASMIKMYEIPSNVPIVSTDEPPKDKQVPLALTLKISNKGIEIYTGVPGTLYKMIANDNEGKSDLIALHSELIEIKKKHLEEKTVILEPGNELSYEEIVKIMDAAKVISPTDPDIFEKGKDGVDIKVVELFGDVIFGNIQD